MHAESDCSSEQWNLSDQDSDILYDYDTDATPKMPSFEDHTVEQEYADSLVLWFSGFLLFLQAKFHVPDSAIDLIIKFWYIKFVAYLDQVY